MHVHQELFHQLSDFRLDNVPQSADPQLFSTIPGDERHCEAERTTLHLYVNMFALTHPHPSTLDLSLLLQSLVGVDSRD